MCYYLFLVSLETNINKNHSNIQTYSSSINQTQQYSTPPFPERLALEKKITHTEYDLLDGLRNVCIRIPL
jgi:hypothetical protein